MNDKETPIVTIFGKKTKLVIAFALLAVATAFIIYLISGSSVTYGSVTDISKLEKGGGELVGLQGKLVPNSYYLSGDGLTAYFKVTDNDQIVKIDTVYTGEIGSLFFNDHSELLMNGYVLTDGTFEVSTLTVKCPSKYQTEEYQNSSYDDFNS